MTRQFYDDSEDPPINPIWKPDYDREPKWKELDEDDIEMFYNRVKDYLNEDQEIDNIDWSRLNFDIIDSDFYREKIGDGFPDEFYELLAKSTNEDNKVQDYRQLPLDINREETTLSFSTGPDIKIDAENVVVKEIKE